MGMKKIYYKLDENKNVLPSSLEEWSKFIKGEYPSNHMHVANENINGKCISTIFLGICHNFNPNSNISIVFETMVFDEGNHSIYQNRYSTWKKAEDGHKEAVDWVNRGCIGEFEDKKSQTQR